MTMDTDKKVCENPVHSGLVTKLSWQMPKIDKMRDLGELFKSFGDPTRVRILWALSIADICVCDISALLKISKSAISHQLRTLRIAGLVKTKREANVVYYSLTDNHIKTILQQGFDHLNR